MLDGLIKDVTSKLGLGDKGPELVQMIIGQLGKSGGLDGVLNNLRSSGKGDSVDSWIGTGENQPLDSADAHQALGNDFVNETAQKLNLDPSEVSEAAGQVLPDVVNNLSPQGHLPAGGDLMGQLQGMLGGLLGGKGNVGGLGDMMGGLGGLLGGNQK